MQRMITVLGERACRVAEALRAGAEEGGFDERGDRTLRSRLAAAGSTASAVQDALDGAAHPVVDGVGNDLLGVRALDFQLTVERLAEAVRGSLSRRRLRRGAGAARYGAGPRSPTAPVVRCCSPVRQGPISPDRTADPGLDGRLQRVGRVLAFGADAWARVATDGAGPGEPTRDTQPEPADDGADPGRPARAPPRSRAAGGAGRDRRRARDRSRHRALLHPLVLGGDHRVRRLRRHVDPRRHPQQRLAARARARSAGSSSACSSRRSSVGTPCSRSC